MKITIFTLGTRGDTEPYLALAAGLHKAGHRVTLVAPQRYSELIRAQGVNAQPMRLDVQDLFEKPQIDAILKGRNALRMFRAIREVIQAVTDAALDDY